MSRTDILTFLRDPRSFSSQPTRADLWIAGLDEVAVPAIDRAAGRGEDARPLRDAQVSAWRELPEQRLGLIQGPPGTGKTFTLAWMAVAYIEARRRVGLPCRVLVTAFTRNAILNLLEGIAATARDLVENELTPAFLGNVIEQAERGRVRCRPLREFAAEVDAEHSVVGCTTWGLFRALDEGWHGGPKGTRVTDLFDLVCLDEASQIQLPQALLTLAGLREDGRVLVAGDNRQLPPIGSVHDWSLDDRMLGGSVYDFLVEAGIPERRLSETFRLNEPLTEFPARHFYGGEYFSAAAVKDQRLALNPGWQNGLEAWQQVALSPEFPISVLLYDGPPAGTRNQNEVELVRQLVECLWSRVEPRPGVATIRAEEFWSEQLAVVSPHRAQNVAIREALSATPAGPGCVVETVERIQGRERDAIICSYTVADPEFALAEAGFLFSPQRFNVALTRARSKFVLLISRALLEVAADDEGQLDAASLLREFVFDCTEVGRVTVEPRPGQHLQLTLCVRSFADSEPLSDELLEPGGASTEPQPPPPMTRALLDMLVAIDQLSARNIEKTGGKYRDVPDWKLAPYLARRSVEFDELRALFLNGHIRLTHKTPRGSSPPFWTAEPRVPIQVPMPCDEQTVRSELQGVILGIKARRRGPLYHRVRDLFAWPDKDGTDRLWPILRRMESAGLVRLREAKFGGHWVDIEEPPLEQTPLPPPSETLTDDDFALLNALEDLEVRRINFGIFEAWLSPAELALETSRNRHDVAESLRRLDTHGHLMRTDEEVPRVRSRMAELAREVRYVKQRFAPDDANGRPYLVRALKVLARNRDKPLRDREVARVFAELKERVSDVGNAEQVLASIEAVLLDRWGPGACISGFQERALKNLTPAWVGLEEASAAVITADTGSGKTEAACLPLLFGAAVDALRGVRGVRAVLVYPRIRLASNQAQRLTSYMRELCLQPGMPRLTLGLQTGDVPRSWDAERRRAAKAAAQPDGKPPVWIADDGGDGWKFPFFACPGCGASLRLLETGSPQDKLSCSDADGCGWSFEGWVGTKEGLKADPPHIFLPVTESLHQWMQRPEYGPLFGDLAHVPGAPAPPRAVLADEIHLYSLVAGAQVGYALRRLLARMRANGTRAPLAIGMSATLGEPARVWSDLVGVSREQILRIGPKASEREEGVRGREYFYFVQPEVESRGHDIAGASTTIQALMCLAHGMRRRTGDEGGFRGIVFLDSIDKLKRLHADYRDAEEESRLAGLRTVHRGSTPRCESRSDRCGREPETCDRFRNGECWFFAANDGAQWTARGRYEPGRNLAVGRNPIFSGTRGNADEIVRSSDLVFSTSSLEVGFDDPDMTLVYQHYSPQNLASFIQRKGRGGRGADDRPITGVTLSVYSPRDTWYFRSPERMLDATDFEVPLNCDNYFVRRGQLLSLILDWAARWSAQDRPAQDPNHNLERIFEAVAPAVREIFGSGIYKEMDARDLSDLWGQALREAREGNEAGPLSGIPLQWGKALPQVPDFLFSPINLPLVRVSFETEQGRTMEKEEDVTLAFSECAPGRGTRRWGYDLVHWTPYAGPRAPMFPAARPARYRRFSVATGIQDPGTLARLLPRQARDLLGAEPQLKYIRPTCLPVQTLGMLRGRRWTPYWAFDDRTRTVLPYEAGSRLPTIHHKSTGRLLGTVISVADDAHALRFPVDSLAGLTDGKLTSFKCHRHKGRRTGLRVTHAFWGADLALVLERQRGPRVERTTEHLRQVFTAFDDPASPALFGYGMEAEGICLELDSDRLDRFVAAELDRCPPASVEGSWLRAQFFRYLIATDASTAGINGFQARYLAELVVSAAALPDLRDRLAGCLQTWNWARFGAVLSDCFQRLLSQSPVLTSDRIDSMLEALEPHRGSLKQILVNAVRGSADPTRFQGWLRTAVLQGIAIRLKQLFVLHGRGDERKVLLHASLPVQFGGEAHDRITVCEKGGFGDGTTRTFLGRVNEAFAEWRTSGLVDCPNARADQAVADAFALASTDGKWRRLDPSDLKQLESLSQALGLDPAADSSALQLVGRLLFGKEEIFGERFEYFDLFGEIQKVRVKLREPGGDFGMLREPGTWELVGAVVHAAARDSAETPGWSRLLAVYGGIEDAADEESLAPRARLADQIYRISARLCPDGCQACLHLGSDVMSSDLVATTVSRRVLERFWALVEAEGGLVEPSPESDTHLFPPAWSHMVSELREIHGHMLRPGGDVVGAQGRVVGATVGELVLDSGTVHLVDETAPWAKSTEAALKDLGARVVRLEPRRGIDAVLDALEQ